jgi:hypothetical protein
MVLINDFRCSRYDGDTKNRRILGEVVFCVGFGTCALMDVARLNNATILLTFFMLVPFFVLPIQIGPQPTTRRVGPR